MKSLCIKTNNSKSLDYLLNELKYADIKNICFSTNKFKHYKNIIIHYTGTDNSYFYSKISYLLSFFVIDEIEDSLLKKCISKNYFYFNNAEKNKILEICYDLLSENYYDWFDKKFKSIYNSFLSYISKNKSIVLEGFINFRLQKYLSILDDFINDSVNSYIIEKEYLEFISLLKLYVNSQQSNIDIVHLVYNSFDSILLDEQKNIIDTSDNLFNARFLSDISFSSHDYALNTLLTLVPKKIYIHLIDNCVDNFINTLQLVFENRIQLCLDCDICKLYKSNTKIKK